ncbi:MAG: LamG-like jellyroll fold domain-containing protein [Planctomycetota bacterium]
MNSDPGPNPTPFSSALSFNGTSDFAQLPSNGFTNFTNGFSAGVWAYTSSVAYYSRYFDFGNGAFSDSIDLTREGTTNNLKLEVWKGGAVTTLVAPGAIKVDTWQYLSVTVSNTGVATLYVNGTSVATSTNTGFVPSVVNRPNNYLGKSNNGSFDALFEGKLNSLSVWNKTLSAAEVQAAPSTAYTGSESGLVGFWRLTDVANGTFIDRSPNARNGTATGSTVAISSPAIATSQNRYVTAGRAMTFDGVNDFVNLPSAGLSDFSQGYTIGFWANTSSVAAWSRYLDFGNGPLNDNILLTRVFNTNDLSLTVYRGGSAMGITAPNVIQLDTWQHFSVTVTQSGTATIYVNGVAVATNTSPSFIPNNVTRVNNYIGKSNWPADALFKGQMRDLSIWKTALTPAQVAASMTTLDTGNAKSPSGYWPLSSFAPLNGTTAASTVTINSPAVVSGQPSYVTAGSAMTFDGVSTAVQLPSAGFRDFSQGFSAGVWAYSTSVANWGRYFDFGNGPNSDNIVLSRNYLTNDLTFFVAKGSSIIELTAPNVIQLNTWQYLSVTVTPSGLATLYVNGNAVASTTNMGLVPNVVNRANDYIGKSNFSSDALFKGQMSSLSVWNAALTPAQVTAGMTTSYTGNENNLVGFWALSGPANTPTRTTTIDNTFTNAQVFNGSSTFLNATPNASCPNFADLTTGFSASLWANTSAVGNYARYFDFGNPGGGGEGVVLTREGTTNNLRLEVWKNGGVTTLVAPGAIQLNRWQHFSVTVTGSGVATLFVNGNPVATSTSPGFIPSVVNRPSCYLGKSNNSNDALFQGQMSNFSFWKTALTPAQVQAASNAVLSGSEANLAYYDSLGFIPQSVTPNITTPAALPYSTTTAQVFNETFVNAQGFNGSSTFVNAALTASSPGVANLTNGFSAGLWAYTSAVGNYARYFDIGNTGGGGENVVLTRDGTSNNLKLEVWKNGSLQTLVAIGAIQLNTWQHFSVTVTSSGVATIYVNGAPVATGTSQGFVPNVANRANCYLGKSNNPVDALFQGQMSNFSFWNRPLTPAEVQATSYTTYIGSEANLVSVSPMGFSPLPATSAAQVIASANSSISIPGNKLTDFSQGFSAGVWAYTSSVANWARYFDFGNGPVSDNILLTRAGTSNDLSFTVFRGGSPQSVTATNVIQLNTWQYLSVSVTTAGVATLYVNGAPVATNTNPGLVPNVVARANDYVGKSNWPADSLFQGKMMGLSVWNKALTPAQMSSNANLATPQPTGNEPSLVVFVPMDGSPAARVLDRSPRQLNGIPQGGIAYAPTGSGYNTPYAGSLTLNGTSTFVTLPGTGFRDFSQGFSAGMWAYTTSVADSSQYFSFGNGPNSDNIVLRRDATSNNLRFAVLRGSSSQGITASNVIQLNTWQYLSVTVTPAGVATIYVNGVAVATDTNPGFVPNVVDRTTNYLAKSPWGNALFQGQMSSVSVWNTPLSQAQIQAGMSRAYSGTEPGLVCFLPMNETNGSTVDDRSPNRNDGTVNGGIISQTTYTGNNQDNLDFQAATIAPGTTVAAPANTAWTYTGSAGITSNTGNLPAPVGTQVATLPGNSSMSTTLTGFAPNQTYSVSFQAAQPAGSNQSVEVLLDGQSLGTYTPPAATNTSGTPLQSAMSFDGRTSYVSLPSSGMNDFKNGFTASVWAYTTSTANNYSYFDFGNGGGSDNIVLQRDGTSNQLNLQVNRGGSKVELTTTSNPIVLNTWQYFSVTIDPSGGAKIFLNGNIIAQAQNSSFVPNDVVRTQNFVGKSRWPDLPLFQGQMGDLSVWKVALWPSEVMTGYTTGYTGTEPNLVGLWHLGDANTTSQGLGALSGARAYGNFVPGTAIASTAGLPFPSPMSFDGNSNYVSLPSTGLSNFSNGFSAGVWVCPSNTAYNTNFFDFGNGNPSNNIELQRGNETDDLILYVYRGGSSKSLKAIHAITQNTWQYFSVTITPSGVATIYKNGIQIAQDSSSSYVPNNVDRYTNYVGGSHWSQDKLFQGQMADLSVWNRAISADDVRSAYTSGLQGNENGLVQLYRLGNLQSGGNNPKGENVTGEVRPVISTTDALPMQRPMNFDGRTNYVILPSTGLDNFTGGFSAGAWVNPTGARSHVFDFGQKNSDSINLEIAPSTDKNFQYDLSLNVFKGTSKTNLYLSNAVTLNTWQYFSVTISPGGEARIYRNGVEIGRATNGGFVPNTVTRDYAYAGLSSVSGDLLYQGQMGDLTVWNKTLSADEVRTGYTTGYQGTERSLVGLWHLGDLGSTVPDSGPNGYDGGVTGNTNALQFTTGYQLFTLPVVTPGAGPHTLTLRGTNSNGGSNAFISNVAFTTSPLLVPSSAITYAPPALTNTSFETDWTGWSSRGNNYAYNPTGPGIGWSFVGNAGITKHGYGLDTSYSVNGQSQGSGDDPPEGNWEAFLQSGYGPNGSMSQTVSGFVAGQSYDIALFTKARNDGWRSSPANDLNYRYGFRSSITVSMDGVALGTYQVASSINWQQITIPGIVPGPGNHTFTINTNGALPLNKNGTWVTTNPDGSIPDLTALIDQVQFLNSGVDTVAAIQSPSTPAPSNGVRNSYSAFTVSVSGVDIGMQVFFDGKVNLIFGDVFGLNFQRLAQDLTQSYKATAAALAGAYNQSAAGLQNGAKVVARDLETAQNEVSAAAERAASQAKAAARKLVKDLNRIGNALKKLFNYSVSDATIYYDPTGTFNQTPAYTAKSDAAGGFAQLELPEQLTGQLVGYGGIDTATGLPNDAIFTAVATSDVVSPLTTLVNRLVVQGYSETEAIAIINSGFGIPATPGDPKASDGGVATPYDINAAGTLVDALAGDRASSLAFAAEVKTYLVAHEAAALLMGLPGKPAGLAMAGLMTKCFGALTDLFRTTTGTVNLSNPEVIGSLIQATATASGLTIDASLSTPAAGIIARVVGGIVALETQDPTASSAPGTQSFLQRVAAFQTLADGTIAQKLTQAAGLAADAPNGIISLAANYSSEQLVSDAAQTVIGNLLAPELSVVNPTGSTGAGQSNFLTFEVRVTGEASPLLPVSVNYTTADGTATAADGDYTPVSGTLTWAPGDTAPKFIQVPIGPGTAIQAAKQFTMQLSSPTNAILRFAAGVGTIENTVFGTTTTLTINPTSATAFTPVEATVTVTNQDGTNSPAAGTVSFYEGDTLLGMRTLDATGTVTVATAQPLVGNHFIHVVYNGNTIPGAKYTPSNSNTVNINVTKASQSISFAPIGDTTYGVSPIPLAATSSFGLPVSFAVISGPATITDGNLVVTGAGTVVVRARQPGDGNINAAVPVDVTFSVAKATLTVTANDQRMVYGAALPTLTYAISGFVGNDSASGLATSPTLSTVAARTAVGTYAITAAGLADPNYTAVYVPAHLTIAPATLTVTVAPKTMVYGGAMPTLTYSMAGLVGPDTASTLSEPAVLATTAATSSVGTYPISITVSDPNYSIVVVPAELTITPAALKITADSFTITRNQALPPFTAKYQGLVNGDTTTSLPQQALVTRNSSSNDAGTYTLVPSDAVAPNYAITYEAGMLTINKTQLTLSLSNTNWYPGLGAAQFSGTYTGFLDGEDAGSLVSQPTFAVTGPGASLINALISAGPAEALQLIKANPAFGAAAFPLVVAFGATNVTSKNYDITILPGTLAIPAAKSVTFLTASNTGAVRGDSVTFTAATQIYVDVQDAGTQQTRAFGFIPASTVGTVQFKVDGVDAGTPKAVNAAGEANFTSSSLSTGTHTITAVFSSGLGKAIGGNTQTLQIDTLNATPTATNLSTPETYTEETPLNLTDIVVSDVDSATVTARLTLSIPAAGSLNTGTSGAVTSTYDAVTGVWSASGAIVNVNTLLAALTFTPAPNFNGTFTIGTSVTDGNLRVSGSKTMTGVAVNDEPTDITLSLNAVPENAAAGTAVGTLFTTDVDTVDTFTYTLVSGTGSTDNALFTISGDKLKTAASFDFETKNSYSICIRSTDAAGLFTEKALTVTVVDVFEDWSVVIPDGTEHVDNSIRNGSSRLVKSGNGSLILDRVNSHTGGVVVQAGQLIVRNTRALGTGGLWVMPGASVVFDVGSETVIVNSLTLEAGGTVDLGYGQITIGALGYVYADVQESLAAGHGNGFGGGSAGICSRYASLPLGWTVGYTLNWDGSMTVGYAAIGDTNLSGEVDIIDATNLLSSVKFGTVEAATWSEGDFNYDGLFDVLDLADFITASLFNSGSSRLAAGNSAGSVQQSTTAEPTELTATDAAFITFAVESSSTSTTTVKKSRVVVG